MTNMAKEISKNLIRLRKSIGWSQSELSRKSGLTASAICQIERGDRLPSATSIEKLCKALNCDYKELNGSLVKYRVMDEEATKFFREYGAIRNLSGLEQHIIKLIIKRGTE